MDTTQATAESIPEPRVRIRYSTGNRADLRYVRSGTPVAFPSDVAQASVWPSRTHAAAWLMLVWSQDRTFPVIVDTVDELENATLPVAFFEAVT